MEHGVAEPGRVFLRHVVADAAGDRLLTSPRRHRAGGAPWLRLDRPARGDMSSFAPCKASTWKRLAADSPGVDVDLYRQGRHRPR